MRSIFIFSLVLILFSCQSKTEKVSEIPMTKLDSSITVNNLDKVETKDLDPQVAVNFMNSYIKSTMDGDIGVLEFTESNPNASENLKHELEKMLNKAWEEDPIVGLGFDPFFDAQDFPMKLELADFNKDSGYAHLKGLKEWDEYRVTIKLTNHNGKTLVDGCGVVNIPKNEQAER